MDNSGIVNQGESINHGTQVGSISGDLNLRDINNIAGDFNNVIIQKEVAFEELSLEDLEFKNFHISSYIKSLQAKLESQRLIVLTGTRKIKKTKVAQYLAYFVRKEKTQNNSQTFVVQEALNTLAIGSRLKAELQRSSKKRELNIYLLSNISYQTFNNSLSELDQIAKDQNQYVICTTEDAGEVWRSEKNKQYFCQITVEDVELPEVVEPHLASQGIATDVDDEDNETKKNPFINDFSEEDLINGWFYSEKLQTREQLLAIALSFFDDFYSDQFFAALEQIVENVWQRRDSSLQALDYHDLDKMQQLFSLSSTGNGQESIIRVEPFKRYQLLKFAWDTHRRRILNALPILLTLVINSVRSSDYELYGTEKRRSQLRQKISETISDIGLIAQSSKIVEDQLLILAAQEDIRIQAVAAKALARWRRDISSDFQSHENITRNDFDGKQKFFDIVEQWQRGDFDNKVEDLISFLRKETNNTDIQPPRDYVRSTISLAIGYASEVELEDDLPDQLFNLFEKFAFDTSYIVRDRFLSDTLPRVVRQHINQVEPCLEKFLLEIDDFVLTVAIARSIAAAYELRPNDAQVLLNSWQREAEEKRPNKVLKKVSLRAKKFSVVVLSYGEIEYTDTTKVAGICQLLCQVLSKEAHPLVRTCSITSLGRLAQNHFEIVVPFLQPLANKISAEERKVLADTLTTIYVQQRNELIGGDGLVPIRFWKNDEFNELINQTSGMTQFFLRLIEDFPQIIRKSVKSLVYWSAKNKNKAIQRSFYIKNYSVWINSPRPSTIVEDTVLRWATDTEYPIAQQVAIRTLTNFAERFNIAEAQQIEELKQRQGIQTTTKFEGYAPSLQTTLPPQGWYMGKFIPWLSTIPRAQPYKKSLRNLLPESLLLHKDSRDGLTFVVDKWRKSPKPDVKTLSNRLILGIWLAKLVKLAIAGTVVWGVTSVSMNIVKYSQRLRETQPSEPEPPAITVLALSENLTVDDPDAMNLSEGNLNFDQGNLTVKLIGNITADDTLNIGNHASNQKSNEKQITLDEEQVLYDQNPIGTWQGGQGEEPLVITFNAEATLTAVRALLSEITFRNTADIPQPGLREVSFQVTDNAGAASKTITRKIFVIGDNQKPVIQVPSSQDVKESESLAINGISFEDADSSQELTIKLIVSEGKITVDKSIENGLSSQQIRNNGSDKVTLVGSAEQLKKTLAATDSIKYVGTEDTAFQISINDGGFDLPEDSNDNEANQLLIWPPGADNKTQVAQKSFQIVVDSLNKIPSITVENKSYTVQEDQELTIGGIVIEDDTKSPNISLIVGQGTLRLPSDIKASELGFKVSRNKSKTLVFSGEFTKIKQYLAQSSAIIYKGNRDFSGADKLIIKVDDQGRGKSQIISLTVEPVNDPPILRFIKKTITPPEPKPTPPPTRPTPPPKPANTVTPNTNATIAGNPTPRNKNVRAGTTTNFRVLFELPVGSRVRVLESRRNSDGFLWYRIYSPDRDREGWIASHLIQLD